MCFKIYNSLNDNLIMIVQLVSYRNKCTSKRKVELTRQLFNESEADLLLFPGHTIDTATELERVASKLNNKKTTAFLELKELGGRGLTNWSFKIEANQLLNCHTHQLFASSSEVNSSPFLIESLFNEIKNNRIHSVKSRKVCLLVCGELNVLTNLQKHKIKNKVAFRTENTQVKKKFSDLFGSVDVFLNPLHTPMGNQGKMHKRRVFLSSHGRAYFSTANLFAKGSSYEESFKSMKALQYAYADGHDLESRNEVVTSEYILREFKV